MEFCRLCADIRTAQQFGEGEIEYLVNYHRLNIILNIMHIPCCIPFDKEDKCSYQVVEASYNQSVSFERIGFKEIDDLTMTLEKLNQDVLNASKTTSNILQMSLMPIGGYEIKDGSDYVNVTDYIYKLLNIENDVLISKSEWENIYGSLISNITCFENVYCFEKDNNSVYLRINEKRTDTGIIGVIVDVSDDVIEQMNLRDQLEHDFLTGLYNRNTFYDKVDSIIAHNPDMIGAMIFADLDNLKYVNDTYGHEEGVE